ncbi:MAG: hypothetical protein U5R30_13710 [Deltaproteobacteria bacterium]|nr:hypothetical protein [Deltaproteobacteria bacterium]
MKRVQALLEERRVLEKRLDEALRGGGDTVKALLASAAEVDGLRLVTSIINAPDVKTLQALGDALREQLGSGVAALGATFDDGKYHVAGGGDGRCARSRRPGRRRHQGAR